MSISVILATYKRPGILARTLESFCDLITRGISWELIVVDNAGDTATRDVVEEYKKKLPLKFLIETAPGKNNALNRAIPEAKGELFVFTDDDVIAVRNWLLEMWEGTERWTDYSVFGGRIIPDWPGVIPWWGENNPLNVSLFALHEPQAQEGPYEADSLLPYGPNMAIRRNVFYQGYLYNPNVGPNGSKIYVMGSETELLMRLRDDGYIPVYLSRAVVKHQVRAEQLTKKNLKRRNFRIGFYDVQPNQKAGRRILHCSPYLWPQLVETVYRYCLAMIKECPIEAFEFWCRLYRIRGKMYAQRQYQGAKGNSILQKLLECP